MQIEHAIADEQARHIHNNMLSIAVFNFLSAIGAALLFWQPKSRIDLVIWLIAMACQMIYTIFGWWVFRKNKEFSLVAAHRVFHLSMRTAFISSMIWSLGFYFFLPSGSFVQQLTLFTSVILSGTMSIFSFGSYYRSFLAAFLPFSVAAIVIMSMQRTVNLPLITSTIIFVPAMLLYAWRFTQILLESLQLRFKNAELVEQLTTQQEQLIEQKEVAESATLTKSRFLAAASHDLRQPMHALSLYLSALGGSRLPEPTLHLLSNAKQCAQAMDEMFSELLDISRLDASVVQVEIKAFALARLLDQIRMEFVPQAQAKGLDFKVVDCSAVVFSDPILVERILRNLVSNAIRYTVQGKILVGCRRTNDGVRLSVYDTGSGIAPEQQQSIFEEFYQVSNSERDRTQGLGLGLAIVQRLALLLSTRLTLTSKLGRGSVFSIDLACSDALDELLSPLIIPETTHYGSLMGALIVVIDDESIILNAMQLLLEQWGCTVVVATSGSEALEHLSVCTRVPDVIVCDYRLRNEETGSDVISALREEFNENIPALLITGDTAPEHIKTLVASGFPVLHKPVQDKVLKDALVGLINQVQIVD